MTSAARLPISVEPAAELWFAVQTRYRFEKKVAAQLASKGMEVFLPLRKENRLWGDRKKEVFVPLFPAYAFVRASRSVLSRLVVLQTPGVMGFASSAGSAAEIPAKQVEDLQLLIEEDVPFSLHPFMTTGQKARIRGGPLDGLEGWVKRGEKEKLVISIEAIQRSVEVEAVDCEVEVI